MNVMSVECPFCKKEVSDLGDHCLTTIRAGHDYSEITDLLQKLLLTHVNKNVINDRIKILRSMLRDYPESHEQLWTIEEDVLPMLESMLQVKCR